MDETNLFLMKGPTMNDTTLLGGVSLPQQALVVDLEALSAWLQRIPDHRARRGLQYPLASLLMIGVLANWRAG